LGVSGIAKASSRSYYDLLRAYKCKWLEVIKEAELDVDFFLAVVLLCIAIMTAFPPPPVNTIDWSNVGFKVREG
jgi:hypothetical protein